MAFHADGKSTVNPASGSVGARSALRSPKPDVSVFAFFASDAARWITGHAMAVDGGSRL
jgi:NAD(P)-dependent dehydrogenase (short-subunit alcohol dehydrogenase family)